MLLTVSVIEKWDYVFNFLLGQVWLPPTPPADGTEDYYVDVALDLAYDTSTTITPAELASVAPYR